MAVGEGLSEAELEVVRLLESNDAGAADALTGLDDAGRARVLARVAGGAESGEPEVRGGDAVSEGAVSEGAGPGVGAVVEGAVGGVMRMWGHRLGRLRLVVGGVVLVVLVVLVVRACGGGGGGGGDLLLLSGADDLYVVDSGGEVDRDGRVARDVRGVSGIVVTEGGGSVRSAAASVQGRRVVATDGVGNESVWLID